MTPRVHVHLKATELNASREFYRQFLGVEPVQGQTPRPQGTRAVKRELLLREPIKVPAERSRRRRMGSLSRQLRAD